MSTSTNSELTDIIDRAWENIGRCGTAEELREVIRVSLPPHIEADLIEAGLTSRVQSFFRRQDKDGLPQAPEVDVTGTHMDWALISVEECRFVVRKYMERSTANRKQAIKVADRCARVYGVHIDVDHPDALAS